MRAALLAVVVFVSCVDPQTPASRNPRVDENVFTMESIPLPWSTALPVDQTFTLHGVATGLSTDVLRAVVAEAAREVQLTNAMGQIIPTDIEWTLETTSVPIPYFSVSITPSAPLVDGWHHLRVSGKFANSVTSPLQGVKRDGSVLDIPFRVGSEPLLLSASICPSAGGPLLSVTFSEALQIPSDPATAMRVSIPPGGSTRGCALIPPLNGGLLVSVVLSCGSLGTTVDFDFPGLHSLTEVQARTIGDHATDQRFFFVGSNECVTWRATEAQ